MHSIAMHKQDVSEAAMEKNIEKPEKILVGS